MDDEIGIHVECPHCRAENEVGLSELKSGAFDCEACQRKIEYDDPETIEYLEGFVDLGEIDILGDDGGDMFVVLKDGEKPPSSKETRERMQQITHEVAESVFGKDAVIESVTKAPLSSPKSQETEPDASD